GTDINCIGGSLDHGSWTSECDANTIDTTLYNGTSVTFASQSDEALIPIEGSASFIIGGSYLFVLSWKNPVIGKNSYSVLFEPEAAPYVVELIGGKGTNALSFITITPASE
ncbi:11737_t:CDS:1, partial [Scutellospora calospora]